MATVFPNLSDAIFHYGRERPNAIAINVSEGGVSYRELALLVGRAAVHLRDLGVRPGELVALALPLNAPHVILVFALLRIGAVPVDLPMLGPARLDPQALFGVKRMIAAPGVEAPEGVVVHRLDVEWKAQIQTKSGDWRFPGPPESQFLFSLSSGSTGAPKGVVTSGREWQERYRSAVALFPEFLDAARPPNLLVLGEISFSGFFFFMANQICIGGPLTLIGAAPSLDRLLAEIDRHDDALLFVTPSLARAFLGKAAPGALLLPKLRALVVGAAPLFAGEKRAIRDRLTPNFIEVYGNAATGFICALRAAEMDAHGDSVGRVASGIAVDLVDPRGQALPPGVVGAVRCRGSGVSQRAIAPPSAHEGLREGSFYPGDAGMIDAAGYLHVYGRAAEVIERGGRRTYPGEIEAALMESELVAEASAFSLTADGGEAKLIAVVVARGEPDLEAVARHCRERLPPEKTPDQLFSVSALPKIGPGKIDVQKLRAHIAERLRAAVAAAPKGSPT